MTLRILVVKILRALRINRLTARIYYRYIHGFNSAGKELPSVVRRCFQRAIENGTADKGDYFEFGIFKGHTFLQAQKIAVELGLHGMRFFGFDSFEGLPEPEGIDQTEEEHFYAGQYSCSIEAVTESLTKHGIDWSKTFLIKGYFCDTLNDQIRQEHNIKKVSVALVDCDLYASTVDVLWFLKDFIMDKSILIMDDWGAFDGDDNRGQRRAFAKFLEGNPEWKAEPWFRYGSYGQVFIVHHAKSELVTGSAEL
jgi:hypothetical protein